MLVAARVSSQVSCGYHYTCSICSQVTVMVNLLWWLGNYVKEVPAPNGSVGSSSSHSHVNNYSSPPPPYMTAPSTAGAGSSTNTFNTDEKHQTPHSAFTSLSNVVSAATASASQPQAPAKQPSGDSYVVALFDFEAQQQGDLGFRKGDQIKVLNRSENADDWWTGQLNGKEGMFPGMLTMRGWMGGWISDVVG